MEKTGLPPGQVKTGTLASRHIGEIPQINLKTWRLTVHGEVKRRLKLTFKEILALPSIATVSDFHCVEGWSVLGNRWKGISFETITEIARPYKQAKSVMFECADGYSTSLMLPELLKKDVLLAYQLGDKMLELEHGGPLRLIVPHKYAFKSAMWMMEVKFLSEHALGHWEKRGYSDTANPWNEDRYSE